MVLELRPSHDPDATWGFVGVVVSTADLSASVRRWYRDGSESKADKVITVPAEPADAADLPPALVPFGAVPPLITDIASPWTTRCSTCRAGGPASSSSTWSRTRTPPSRSARCTSVGSSDEPRTRLPGRAARRRVHQVRLQGGDASSGSYCYR